MRSVDKVVVQRDKVNILLHTAGLRIQANASNNTDSNTSRLSEDMDEVLGTLDITCQYMWIVFELLTTLCGVDIPVIMEALMQDPEEWEEHDQEQGGEGCPGHVARVWLQSKCAVYLKELYSSSDQLLRLMLHVYKLYVSVYMCVYVCVSLYMYTLLSSMKYYIYTGATGQILYSHQDPLDHSVLINSSEICLQ